MKGIKIYEPWFFILFGIFHLHRVWGLLDRKSYADFWMGVLEEKGVFYYSVMCILAVFCIIGIITFFKNLHNNYWWRWIYIFGGGYVLFDLYAIATGLNFWHDCLLKMFNVSASYWNMLWSAFILMGGIVFTLGLVLLRKRKK